MSRVSLLVPFLFLCVLPASSMQVRQAPSKVQQLLREEPSGQKNKARVAVEITGCLMTFNTTDSQSSFAKNIEEIKKAGYGVDIFGVVQACNPERDDVLVPIIAEMFKSACGEAKGTTEKGCKLSVDMLPGKLDLLAVADKDILWSTPSSPELYSNGDSGKVYNKLREMEEYRQMSQHYQWKLVKEMRKEARGRYSAVWRAPTDIAVLNNSRVQIPWSQVLGAIKKDPSLWILPSKPYESRMGKHYFQQELTDRIAILSEKAADHYDDMWKEDLDNLAVGHNLWQPESSLDAHMGISDFKTAFMKTDLTCHTIDIAYKKCIYTTIQGGRCQAGVEPDETEAPADFKRCPRITF